MKVISNSKIGAFVDWGLDKDLLLPFAAQASPVEEGRSYVMRVVLDDISGRIIASTRLNRYVDPDTSSLIVGQPVSMLIHRLAPHGALAIVDNRFVGLIPSADLAERVHVGETKRGFVQKIRPDGKIALALSPVGYRAVMNEAPRILEMLHSRGGFLPYSDASNPDEIRKVFGMSKGAFKKVIGGLMRDGQIEITHHGIRLLRS
jgi:predicted RNA-binding protein (virulence factor B family)